MKKSMISLFTVLCITGSRLCAQPSVLFEAGATYFSNDIDKPGTRLYDFFAFTFNTRIILPSEKKSKFSVDIPISFRSRFSRDIVTRSGIHLPLYLTYNVGAGASGEPSDRKIGALLGIGYGYFYQQAASRQDETDSYKESLSVAGPGLQMGVRFPLKKVRLFKVREKDVHPAVTIRSSYLLDIKNRQNSIGSLSLLLGFAF